MSQLIDQLGRPCHDLRISVTNRCQFRCCYCLPMEQHEVMRSQNATEHYLSFDEMINVVHCFAQLGVKKVRLTGGEPLLRKNLHLLVERIKAIEGINEIALTTNGMLLPPVLFDLIEAGLDRVTISLDAVEDPLFAQITGTDYSAQAILDVIDSCLASPLKQVKINTVIQKGLNEHQVIPILKRFRGTTAIVRFIEFMDVGNINHWQQAKVMPAKEVLRIIQQHWSYHHKMPINSGEVAKRYSFDDNNEEFGMITSISQPFCDDCNRVRLSADGFIYNCLFASQGHNIKDVIDNANMLTEKLQFIWRNRDNQYSALRQKNNNRRSKKIEMFVMGG